MKNLWRDFNEKVRKENVEYVDYLYDLFFGNNCSCSNGTSTNGTGTVLF